MITFDIEKVVNIKETGSYQKTSRIYVENNKPTIGKVIFRYDSKLIRNRQKIYEINTIYKTWRRKKNNGLLWTTGNEEVVDFQLLPFMI